MANLASTSVPGLASELWEVVLGRLDRPELSKISLASMPMYSIAVRYLYLDPFKPIAPATNETMRARAKRQRHLLCQLLSHTPALADRVRVFRTIGCNIAAEDFALVVPKLGRLQSAFLGEDTEQFARLCPSPALEVLNVQCPPARSPFWRWLAGQKGIKSLSLSDWGLGGRTPVALAPSSLPKLEELSLSTLR